MQDGLYLYVLANKSTSSVRNPQNNAVVVLYAFRWFLEFAMERDWVDKNVFAKIHYKIKDAELVYLENSEVQAIRSADSTVLSRKGMMHTRDAFLLSCATGLAWSDLCQIDKTKIVNTLARLSLRIKRKKTKVTGIIPLFKEAKEILERYDFDLKMPKYTTYKDRVQRLCAWVGITKTVGTHTGRKTFANRMLNELGVPLETVSKLMLHSSTQTTERYYAKVNETKIQNDTAHIE
jgi:site-specific recombinase XerD